MTIHENLGEFFGKRVVDFKAAGDIADFASTAPRVRCEYDDQHTISDYLSIMLDEPGVAATEALVIGLWCENGETFEATPQTAIELLVSSKDRLPNLRALFVGDIICEENEVSWITSSDMSALWGAFPKLEVFAVRGSNELRLGKINHAQLHTLIVQSGGLGAGVVREALEANAPLRHLELWLGSEGYGANTSVADFSDLLAGRLFPGLETLALRNSEYADDLAEALATAPILDRVSTLDLSLGALTDRGARALIQSGKLGRLAKLDVTHNYLTAPVRAELEQATPMLVADDPKTPDEWDGEQHYYIALSE